MSPADSRASQETQSLWSELSPATVTLPLPAAAPTAVRARVPGSSSLGAQAMCRKRLVTLRRLPES